MKELSNHDEFMHALRRSMIIRQRVALSILTKTVRRGALWSEEYVPQGTIFAAVVIPRDGIDPCEKLKKVLGESGDGQSSDYYLILGGLETTGKGIVKIRLVSDVESTAA